MLSYQLKLLHTFARAAEELGRTPYAISMQVAELEGHLGLRLLQRAARNVAPTLDGLTLLACYRTTFAELDDGIAGLLDAAARRRARIKMAVASTVVAALLSNVLAQLGRNQLSIELSVRELVSPDLLRAVRDGEVDFGIKPFVTGLSDLHFTRPIRAPLVALFPTHLAQEATLSMDIAR